MSSLLEIHDLFRVYPSAKGGVAALQGLTLTVRQGELCVVLGPSGSGKSTLLRIVAAFDRPSAGSVHVSSTEVSALGGWHAARFRSRATDRGTTSAAAAPSRAPRGTARWRRRRP